MVACAEYVPKPPQPAAVPLPLVLLHPAKLAEKKVLKFAMGMNQDLHAFLECVTECLLNSPEQINYGPEIGRQLPEALQAWQRKNDLRMCSILAHYPNDFKIHKNGRARRVESLRSTAAGAYSFKPSSLHIFHF
eukprot:TRINITY_DN21505_c0_g1_i1.p1 TRINITY_DN21505_c0_g1~~TRINITY_DN21505_c0_g1_i1.p1  ORF type:complete len:134 (-),score=31.80 TRINITY_DN21505_c0_g1_i1:342-743(-)